MIDLTKGKYHVRRAEGTADMAAVYKLRTLCFGATGGTPDAFDANAVHVVVEQADSGQAIATFRMVLLEGAQIAQSYASQFYDLTALNAYEGPMLELGRFCIHPEYTDPDILRIAWAALTAFVDGQGVSFMFGCSSFGGTVPAPYIDAFALLKRRHLAPKHWQPRVKAPDIFAYAKELQNPPDLRLAHAAMPPLLRTYLMMGGWVSDHAVVDRAMNTLHVFTGLEIVHIPPARKKLLRALV